MEILVISFIQFRLDPADKVSAPFVFYSANPETNRQVI